MASTPPWDILICPACGARLERADDGAVCTACATRYGHAASGPLDLRLQVPREVTLTVRIGEAPPTVPPVTLEPSPAPEVALTGFELPSTISRRFASWLPRAPRPGARVLDLGCGDT